MKRSSISILTCLLVILLSIQPVLAQSTNKAVPVFKDGEAQVVEAFSKMEDWIRHDLWVETEFGDRLDSLAFQFYSDVTLYWIISIANPNQINMGSLYLTPGAQIRIPTNVGTIIDSYYSLNS